MNEERNNLYCELNKDQKEAVLYGNGPLLILAGAGSGKTRVITYRISHLIKDLGVLPQQIMALTFTNKAALEMKERIAAMVGDDTSKMWVGTFHAVMVKVLRQFGPLLGYQSNFQILDTDEQIKLLKNLIADKGLDKDLYEPRAVLNAISKQKNKLLTVNDFLAKYPNVQRCLDSSAKLCYPLYADYQATLKNLNAMDFDDLLLNAYLLFSQQPSVLDMYQRRFLYIFVDEYQDTNFAQYQLIYMLSAKHRNLCVVGDDDQSIYAFRGADVNIILNFEHDFKDAKVIKLEQNYRSTGNILQAANSIIKHNQQRKAKALWTEADKGGLINYYQALNQQDEASFIIKDIQTKQARSKNPYSDFAILYRVNALSRNLELALLKAKIPFRIYGGQRFYDRKEIKDVLAYLRLISDARDDLAFLRIINCPRRQIGLTTVEKVLALAKAEGQSALHICSQAEQYQELSKVKLKLLTFANLISNMKLALQHNDQTLSEYIEYVQNESGLIEEILNQMEKGQEDAAQRIENLKEMLSDALDFTAQAKIADLDLADEDLQANDLLAFVQASEQTQAARMNMNTTQQLSLSDTTSDEARPLVTALQDYLAMTALNQAASADVDGNFVSLMTLHAAKGLEFNNVYIVGMEESIFPGARSLSTQASLEEERRLAYVGVTRARKNLCLTSTNERLLYGSTSYNMLSRFVKEIPKELLMENYAERHSKDYDLFSYNDTRQNKHNDYRNDSHRSWGNSNLPASTFGINRQSTSMNKATTSAVNEAMKQLQRIKSVGKGAQSLKAMPSLASQQSADEINLADLHVNQKVRHSRLGVAVIKQIEPVAGDAILVLQFENGEIKRLMAKAAHLHAV